jgi:hypothetical protein
MIHILSPVRRRVIGLAVTATLSGATLVGVTGCDPTASDDCYSLGSTEAITLARGSHGGSHVGSHVGGGSEGGSHTGGDEGGSGSGYHDYGDEDGGSGSGYHYRGGYHHTTRHGTSCPPSPSPSADSPSTTGGGDLDGGTGTGTDGNGPAVGSTDGGGLDPLD